MSLTPAGPPRPLQDEVLGLLDAGEHVLAVTGFALPPGKVLWASKPSRPKPGPQQRQASSGMRRLGKAALGLAGVAGVAATLAAGDLPFDPPSLARLLGRVPAHGHVNSAAYGICEEYWKADSGQSYLVVTTGRLLFVIGGKAAPGRGTSGGFSILQVPGLAVQGALHPGAPHARSRVVLQFTDSSLLTMRFGDADAGQAGELIAAVGELTQNR